MLCNHAFLTLSTSENLIFTRGWCKKDHSILYFSLQYSLPTLGSHISVALVLYSGVQGMTPMGHKPIALIIEFPLAGSK